MEKKFDFQKYLPYILSIALFLLIALSYFPQVIEGKKLLQHDHQSAQGNAKEIVDYRKEHHEEPLWTNSLFGGMPAYLISTKYPGNLLTPVYKFLRLDAGPLGMLFMLLLGFYILLVSLKINPWLSVVGSIAFAFATFNFIIIMVGHNTQVYALSFMPAVLAGIILAFRDKKILGAGIAGVSLALQLIANHPQITYYTLLIALIFGLSELVFAIIQKTLPSYLKSVGVLAIAVLLALGSNFGRLYTTYEYSKYSMRTKTELSKDKDDQTNGLPKSYITGWSYGKGETMTLLIPGFKGGSNTEQVSEKSATYKLFAQNNPAQAKEVAKGGLPLYWGTQPSTAGPVYLGAIVIFLFVLGLFIVENRFRWWLLVATVLGIMLSWGRNFPAFTDFFINHVPGYNKFRTVSMSLVIAGFTMPLMALLALKELFWGQTETKKINTGLKWSFGITAGITLLFVLIPSLAGDFIAPADSQYQKILADVFREDRISLLRGDAFRSFILITLSAAVILLYRMKKLKLNMAILALGILFIFDFWTIDKRYLNDSKFVSKSKAKQVFVPTTADKMILKDTSPDYRVLNLTTSPFQDASTSYFHKSIGGYHGAKMRRYQDLIDTELIANIAELVTFLQNPANKNPDSVFSSLNIINMLNTKYFIVNPNGAPLVNPTAAGNAWFVNKLVTAENADEELALLKKINIRKEATTDKKYEAVYKANDYKPDSSASIILTSYQPNKLIYNSQSTETGVAVFSEIFYEKGWNATIDNQPVEHFRVDYLLRGMIVPPGDHEIVFSFHPKSYYMGEKISLAGSLLLILALAGAVVLEIKKKKEEE